MNITEIAKLLKEPQLIQHANVNELEKLCLTYPFAQTFQLLYLKALSDSNSIHFDIELKKRACSISNRTILFDLVNKHEAVNLANEPTAVSTEPNEVASPIELTAKKDEETIPEVDWTNIEPAESIVVESEPIETTKIAFSEDSPLDLEILHSAATAVIENNTEQFIALSKEDGEEIEIHHPPERPVVSDTKSFMDWIKSSEYKYAEEVKKPVSQSKKLIEDFIQNEPKIERGKTEFFSAPKTAKQSVSSEAMPISATLAKIVALQGNFPKAIEIYQQLILKYPEKKTFFVAQISALEKKLAIK